jgi:hypothetical protein
MSARTPPFVPHERGNFSRNRFELASRDQALATGESHARAAEPDPQAQDRTKQRRMP